MQKRTLHQGSFSVRKRPGQAPSNKKHIRIFKVIFVHAAVTPARAVMNKAALQTTFLYNIIDNNGYTKA